MRIVAVGRASDGPERVLFERYAARLRPRPLLVEIADGRGTPGEVMRREAEAIEAALPDRTIAVVLDRAGDPLTSRGLAERVDAWNATGRPVAFLIGGAEGLDARLIERAEARISLGALTWPHLLARAMLAEQLYRAQTILSGHPYHREQRRTGPSARPTGHGTNS